MDIDEVIDEVIDKVWMRLGEEKYLVWEVRIVLLLATAVSALTMPLAVMFLLAVASAIMFAVTSKKSERPVPPKEKTRGTLS